jgi:hypothetical protein
MGLHIRGGVRSRVVHCLVASRHLIANQTIGSTHVVAKTSRQASWDRAIAGSTHTRRTRHHHQTSNVSGWAHYDDHSPNFSDLHPFPAGSPPFGWRRSGRRLSRDCRMCQRSGTPLRIDRLLDGVSPYMRLCVNREKSGHHCIPRQSSLE